MDYIINNILDNIKLNKNDINEWWNTPIQTIRSSEFLVNPENNYINLQKYLIDEIQFHKIEIQHVNRYTPVIFNKNVWISREYELEVLEKILIVIKNIY